MYKMNLNFHFGSQIGSVLGSPLRQAVSAELRLGVNLGLISRQFWGCVWRKNVCKVVERG